VKLLWGVAVEVPEPLPVLPMEPLVVPLATRRGYVPPVEFCVGPSPRAKTTAGKAKAAPATSAVSFIITLLKLLALKATEAWEACSEQRSAVCATCERAEILSCVG
jgi:hypothetical protein